MSGVFICLYRLTSLCTKVRQTGRVDKNEHGKIPPNLTPNPGDRRAGFETYQKAKCSEYQDFYTVAVGNCGQVVFRSDQFRYGFPF